MFKCAYVFEERVDLLNLDEIVMEFVNRRRRFVCLCHKTLQAPNVINMFIRLNKYECLKLSVNGLCGWFIFFSEMLCLLILKAACVGMTSPYVRVGVCTLFSICDCERRSLSA